MKTASNLKGIGSNVHLHQSLKQLILLLFVITGLFACDSADRPIETPTGPQMPVFRDMHVIGIIRRTTITGNQKFNAIPSGEPIRFSSEDYEIEVPVGTQLIVPAIKGWVTAYGKTTPDNIEDILADGFTWTIEDHHLAMQSVDVNVTDINAPDGDRQTANIKVTMLLRDVNSDDPWFGIVGYHLICFGFDD